MATGAAYSGKEWTVGLGIADIDTGSSAGAIGATTQIANVESLNLMRVSAVNDIAWSAGYQAAEIVRTGTRSMTSEDYVNQMEYDESSMTHTIGRDDEQHTKK